jgi:hypothetical protein
VTMMDLPSSDLPCAIFSSRCFSFIPGRQRSERARNP